MISESKALMTLFDVAIVFVCLLTIIAYGRYRGPIRELGARTPTLLCIFGLSVLASLYLGDLFTMLVLPVLSTHEIAMRAMTELHRHWSWFISLVGIGALATGTVLLIRMLFPALARYESRLRREVEEHTLTEKALRESQFELVHRERLAALGMLTATVSHELRNPLGTIQNAVHVLNRKLTGPDASGRRSVDLITRSVERCNTIVDDLLNYGKPHEFEKIETRIDSWCQQVLDEYPWPAGVKVERRLGSGKQVDLDRNQMQSALTNVIRNACDAVLTMHPDESGSEAASLTITTAERDDRLEVSVEDNGPGIEPEDLSRVTEPLFTTKAAGVGLGLSIAHRVMKIHGGGVELRNLPEGGLRVVLWLPGPNDNGAMSDVQARFRMPGRRVLRARNADPTPIPGLAGAAGADDDSRALGPPRWVVN